MFRFDAGAHIGFKACNGIRDDLVAKRSAHSLEVVLKVDKVHNRRHSGY